MRSAIAAAVILAAPGLAVADEWREAAEGQLEFVGLTLEGEGWSLDRDLVTGGMGDQQAANLPLRLDRRKDYAIVAVCDENCGDLDLFLYDEEGVLVTSDASTAGLPIVTVNSIDRATYDLEVRMFDCVAEPCRYSVAVFSTLASTPVGRR